MPNYNESSVTGTKYTRSNRVVLVNELGQEPSIHFQEQEVVILGPSDKVMRPGKGIGVTMSADNQTATFPLLNPLTGATIGTASYQDVYVMMHSLYYALAAARDAA